MLAEAMRASGVLGAPHEYLHVWALDAVRGQGGLTLTLSGQASRLLRRLQHRRASTYRYTKRSMRRHLVALASRTASPNGVFSLKVMWPQYSLALLEKGFDLSSLDVPVTWVRARRSDLLRSAVSQVRAQQTGQWRSTATPHEGASLRYDAAAIRAALDELRGYERSWDEYFASIGVSPYTIVYEDLDADYDGTIAALFEYLGVHAAVPPRQLDRQADTLNDEWVRRFVAEAGDQRVDSA